MITNANDSIHNSEQGVQDGLTKREYFAAMAMQGFASNPEWAKTITSDDWDEYKKRLSEASADIADALIEALNKKQTT